MTTKLSLILAILFTLSPALADDKADDQLGEYKAELVDVNADYENAMKDSKLCIAHQEKLNDLNEKIFDLQYKKALKGGSKPKPLIPEKAKEWLKEANETLKNAQGPDDYEKAEQGYLKVISLAPGWSDPFYNLAKAHEMGHWYELAVIYYRMYLLAAPKAKDAKQVMKKLYELKDKMDRSFKLIRPWIQNWITTYDGGDCSKASIYVGLSTSHYVDSDGTVYAGGRPDGKLFGNQYTKPTTNYGSGKNQQSFTLSDDGDSLTFHAKAGNPASDIVYHRCP